MIIQRHKKVQQQHLTVYSLHRWGAHWKVACAVEPSTAAAKAKSKYLIFQKAFRPFFFLPFPTVIGHCWATLPAIFLHETQCLGIEFDKASKHSIFCMWKTSAKLSSLNNLHELFPLRFSNQDCEPGMALISVKQTTAFQFAGMFNIHWQGPFSDPQTLKTQHQHF